MINNLNYYNVFYMVAKTGSISRAANQLYISQPSLSQTLRQIEDEVARRSSTGVPPPST